ncbi:cytochrome C oxidase subunit IV family protein [Luteolibacter algae]|uniref:Cytochrome C oxidase subunit IV family protein n=1 Tax=Luteolibacter algae TaxID=454151 RepID=A0ABW5D7Y0_9BACT
MKHSNEPVLPANDTIPPDSDFEHIQLAKKRFLIVGCLLFIFTITTVAVATVPALDIGRHGFDAWDAALGLLIATIKASMVALVFMHLNHEKKTVYFIIGLATIHAVGLYFGTHMHFADMTYDPHFYDDGIERIDGDGGTDIHETQKGAP